MKKEKVLLVGGAGYVGRHIALELRDASYSVCILDNLSTGTNEYLEADRLMVADILEVPFEEVKEECGSVRAVIHLAALTDAGASVDDPVGYFELNTIGAIRAVCLAHHLGADAFILSSTAAVYGDAKRYPIEEDDPKRPSNPYGASKRAAEVGVNQLCAQYGISCGILRYFNVAGCDPDGRTGDMRPKGDTLMHKLIEAAESGADGVVRIYGDDYDTRDGSAERDFVHVMDVASAHRLIINELISNRRKSLVGNVGYGKSTSVKAGVHAFLDVLAPDRISRVEYHSRRAGDIAVSYASNRALKALGWKPKYDDITDMIRDTMTWRRKVSPGDP